VARIQHKPDFVPLCLRGKNSALQLGGENSARVV
jgi:hypothetical protein